MATTIITKYGSGAPTASDVVRGELAVDTENGRLYTENIAGSVVELGTNPTTLAVDTDTLVVDATNNRVGIGLTSPDTKLHLSDGGTPELRLESTDSSVVSGQSLGDITWESNDVSGGGQGVRAKIHAEAENAGTIYGLVFSTGAGAAPTEKVRITNTGNVGIGTTSPVSPLTTSIGAGSAGSLNNQIAMTHSGASNSYHIKTIRAAADDEPAGLAFVENTTERMRIDSSGNLNLVNSGLSSLNFTTDGSSDYARITGGKSGSGIGELQFWTYSGGISRAATIDQNGNLGINQSNPSTTLHVGDGSDADRGVVTIEGAGGEHLIFSENSTHTHGANAFALRPASGTSFIIQEDGASTPAVVLESDGTFRVKSGSIVVDTSGDGILLGGTAAANKLDDYEEGTFTVTISCDSGTISLEGGANLLSYTKIGRLVHIQGSLNVDSVSSPSGQFRITNLPFAMDTSIGEGADISSGSAALYNMASDVSGLINAEVSVVGVNTTILIRDGGGTAAGVSGIANKFDGDSLVRLSLTYHTTS